MTTTSATSTSPPSASATGTASIAWSTTSRRGWTRCQRLARHDLRLGVRRLDPAGRHAEGRRQVHAQVAHVVG
eukprot:6697758-Alexandrium_andersonii.AAC.1